MPVARALRVAWIGSQRDQCGQLLERVRQQCGASEHELIVLRLRENDWDPGDLSSADRLVLACETRLDYPWQTIAALQSGEHHVPWGVVTSDWYAGARRTGLGPVTHWQMPWYRWWEAWYGWFFPELARRISLCPTQFEPITLPIDLATPALSALAPASTRQATSAACAPSRHLLVVATCQQTAHSWQLMAERVGWQSSLLHAEKLALAHCASALTRPGSPRPASPRPASPPAAEHRAEPGDEWPTEVDCVLWDDSVLDRLPGSNLHTQSVAYCEAIRARYPRATLLAALTLGHLALWPALREAGVSDFFIKPSFGLPLSDYLSAR